MLTTMVLWNSLLLQAASAKLLEEIVLEKDKFSQENIDQLLIMNQTIEEHKNIALCLPMINGNQQ